MQLIFAFLFLPIHDGTMLSRERYTFPFATHTEWLAFMNGKGLSDWSVLFDEKTYARLHKGDAVTIERIKYSSDGLSIAGLLITPRTRDKPLPVIIFNRGGTAQWARITFWEILEMARLAERGYVVVASYLRGVGGSEGKPELGGGDIRDTLNLLPLIEAIPQADASRVGMWGFSRGGATTYLSLTKTDRIKAVAVIAGSTDSTTGPRRKEFETHVYPGILAGFEKDPETAVRAISAIHWADRMSEKTPILLLHGTADDRVPVAKTLAFAARLQALDRTYRLIVLENGSHSLAEHYLEVRRALYRWFDHYVKRP